MRHPHPDRTLVPRLRPIGFSDSACRRSLRALVASINAAPTPDAKTLADRLERQSIRFDSDVTDPILNYPNRSPIEDNELLLGWTLSDGKRDRAPIVLREVTPLKDSKGVALYQFTLRRDRYHREVTEEEAATDSCGIPSEAIYAMENVSYLGVFLNNTLLEVRAFDVWLRVL